MPLASLFDESSFATLPPEEILSGFGEVMKTALLADAARTERLLELDPLEIEKGELRDICVFCRDVKLDIVGKDPMEKGLRKVLNLGHTAGHAFESLSHKKGKPVSHGAAVAHGLLVSLILSHRLLGLESRWVSRYAGWLRRNYGALPFSCADYDALWNLAIHDKKNRNITELSYTLISEPGHPHYDVMLSRSIFEESLDLYQELQGR